MRAPGFLHATTLFVVLYAGICNPVASTSDVTGPWGGEHIALLVKDTGSTIEYDCATGSIAGAIHPGNDGRFENTGIHIRGHGGPVRQDEIPDAHPASYSGRVQGNTMTLTVRETDSGAEVGTFKLERGVAARVFKCL